MKTVDLVNGPVKFIGALDLDRSGEGVCPRRLPAWTRPQITDPFLDAIVAMASGVRMSFESTTDVIELDLAATSFRFVSAERRPLVFQLVVDRDAPIDTLSANPSFWVLDLTDRTNLVFEPGGAETIRFEGLGTTHKQCEIWLPQAATLRVSAMRIDEDARINPALRDRRTWVHYGSSISHCMEAEAPTATWPAVAARLGGVDVHSLGLAGQCMLDQFVARTIRDLPADVISLKLGINIVNGDTMRERTFGPAVHGFLDTVRDGQPDTPILVVSPIWCPSAEHTPGPTVLVGDAFATIAGHAEIRDGCLTLTRIREILAGIVQVRRDLGDANLHYLDGLTLFGSDDAGDQPDGLHPNSAGYERIGDRFARLALLSPGALAASPRAES